MTNRNFTVIKGGLSTPRETGAGSRKFVSAFVTDTRLMGVVGLYIHWEVETGAGRSDFYQLFCFDAEESGLETYRSISGSSPLEISYLEQTVMGGLGGKKIDVSQKEALFLVQSYAGKSAIHEGGLPEGYSEYKFMLEPAVKMTPKEQDALFAKQCCQVTSVYQAINYFLMRCFAKDGRAAEFLLEKPGFVDAHPQIPPATLCKNTINHFENKDGLSYLCESLIEHDAAYMLVVSEIIMNDLKISSCEQRSSMQISPIEAAMMLSRSEFVTVYEILAPPEEFNAGVSKFMAGTLITMHEYGRLFLSFNKNNDHVGKQIFRLNEDVFGLYYITDFGQLIIAAYSVKEINSMEKKVQKSIVSGALLPIAKYEFKEPVLYEFIQSGFDDFDEFLDFIKE